MMLFSRLQRSSFLRNVVILIGGTAFAQVITIAASPLLSRLYSPEEFGSYALFIAITTPLITIAGGRYEMAVVLPESGGDGLRLALLTTLIALSTCALLLLLTALANGPITSYLGDPSLGPWLYAMPGFIFLSVTYAALRYWFNRKGAYRRMSQNAVLRSTIIAALNIALGWVGFGTSGLIYGMIVGQLAATGFFLWQFWREEKETLRGIRLQSLFALAFQHRNFPQYLIPSGFVESASSQYPFLALTSYYGKETVGLFALATRMVNLPMSLVSNSVGDVFRQKASEVYAKTGSCRGLFVSCSKRMLILCLVPFGLLYWLAPTLFHFVFGPEWTTSGEYVRILSLMLLVRFVSSPLSIIFYIANQQKWDLVLQTALWITIILAMNAVGRSNAPASSAIKAYAIVYLVKYMIEYLMSYSFTVKPSRTAVSPQPAP